MNCKGFGINWCSPDGCNTLAFTWRDLGKPRAISVKIAEIRTKTSAEYKSTQDRQCTYNVTLKRARATTVAVEK